LWVGSAFALVGLVATLVLLKRDELRAAVPEAAAASGTSAAANLRIRAHRSCDIPIRLE